MPNHVTNELIFRDVDAALQAEILAKVCDSEGRVGFEILVPEPLNMWRGNEGLNHREAFGSRLGMEWARENWGTKWNAYKSRPIKAEADSLTIVFDTAWRPPYPWLAAVFNHFQRSFDHNWLDEGSDQVTSGQFQWVREGALFNQGPQWRESPASPETTARLYDLSGYVP